jgi:uncharacterized paraquat-inducible protein A
MGKVVASVSSFATKLAVLLSSFTSKLVANVLPSTITPSMGKLTMGVISSSVVPLLGKLVVHDHIFSW